MQMDDATQGRDFPHCRHCRESPIRNIAAADNHGTEQQMATSKEYGLGEFTFPRGWFMIGESAKITDKPQGVKFFGQEFALYRGKQSGKVILLDAYCPHMGTHLARNSTSYVAQDGAVEGDSIRCPYHAWRFGPDGKCNHIPYSSGPIPPAAKVRSWQVEEHMGAVFVWHDPEGGEPDYEVPLIPEINDAAWVPIAFDDLGVVGCHTQWPTSARCMARSPSTSRTSSVVTSRPSAWAAATVR
jgi:3-ketosteroid 9alpha-monooxygenase subunit A